MFRFLRIPTVPTEEEGSTWLRLFFDLIYVAILVELGNRLASNLDLQGVVESTGSTTELAQALKDQHQNPPANSTLHNLPNVDLDVVDWLEIAEAVLDDVKSL
jgi:hypothetical protein